MKRLKYLLWIIVIAICFFPKEAFASGSISVSTSSLSILKGSSSTFTITANNAAGRIDISTSDSSIASISDSSVFLDMQSKTITVVGNNAGTATITVTASDATTYDDEDLSGSSYTISVVVNEPVSNNQPPVQENNNNKNNNSSQNNEVHHNNSSNTPTVEDNRSTNNKLKELKVEGYSVVKVDDNHYTLTVSNHVTNIQVSAIKEDEKATLSGDGVHELIVGENTIEVIVTSESEIQNKIILTVTRKDGYYIEDLDSILKDSSIEDIEITISQDTNLSSEDIKAIKESKKVVTLNQYNEEKKLLYSWIVDGAKIKTNQEFSTKTEFASSYIKEIATLSNYADGKYIHFDHSGKLPTGTKIRLYVGDKFQNGDIVNVYHYQQKDNQLQQIQKKLTVKEEYIEFVIEHCSDYFLTQSTVGNATTKKGLSLSFILAIVEGVIILLFIVLDILKKNPLSKILTKKVNNHQ